MPRQVKPVVQGRHHRASDFRRSAPDPIGRLPRLRRLRLQTIAVEGDPILRKRPLQIEPILLHVDLRLEEPDLLQAADQPPVGLLLVQPA